MDYIIGQPRPGQPVAANAASGGVGAPVAPGAMIIDGTQANFMSEVIDASRAVPVLVDFWAGWCGPCKQLTPMLEKLVIGAGGRVKLVKIDIEANKALVQQLVQLGLPLQSIPVVAAFWQGQILDLFQGAVPESEARRFIEGVLKAAGGAMPSADLLAEGRAALEEGAAEHAAAIFSALIAMEPENPEGWGGLVRALLEAGNDEGAAAVLADVPAKIAGHAEISGARAALQLKAEGRAASAAADELRGRIAANPQDYEALYELATALNAAGQRAEAAEQLLTIIRRDREWNEGAARQQLLRFFEAWGNADPSTLAARRRLSSILFS